MNDPAPLNIVEIPLEEILKLLPEGSIVVDATVRAQGNFYIHSERPKYLQVKVSHPCSPLVWYGHHLTHFSLEEFHRHADEFGKAKEKRNDEPKQHDPAGQ